MNFDTKRPSLPLRAFLESSALALRETEKGLSQKGRATLSESPRDVRLRAGSSVVVADVDTSSRGGVLFLKGQRNALSCVRSEMRASSRDHLFKERSPLFVGLDGCEEVLTVRLQGRGCFELATLREARDEGKYSHSPASSRKVRRTRTTPKHTHARTTIDCSYRSLVLSLSRSLALSLALALALSLSRALSLALALALALSRSRSHVSHGDFPRVFPPSKP